MACRQVSGNLYYCRGGTCTASGSVWGRNPYTSNSCRCLAARHSGAVGINGGFFVCEPKPGQSSYAASTLNNITSSSYGAYDSSILVSAKPTVTCFSCSKPLFGQFVVNQGGYQDGAFLGVECFYNSAGCRGWVYCYCYECYAKLPPSAAQATEIQALSVEIRAMEQELARRSAEVQSLSQKLGIKP
jgi:hypothetical protein